jgi:hypothetical protein
VIQRLLTVACKLVDKALADFWAYPLEVILDLDVQGR